MFIRAKTYQWVVAAAALQCIYGAPAGASDTYLTDFMPTAYDQSQLDKAGYLSAVAMACNIDTDSLQQRYEQRALNSDPKLMQDYADHYVLNQARVLTPTHKHEKAFCLESTSKIRKMKADFVNQ